MVMQKDGFVGDLRGWDFLLCDEILNDKCVYRRKNAARSTVKLSMERV